MRTRTIHVLLIAVVALGAAAGIAAADGELAVTVDDVDDEPTVTVTENDSAVANAEVTAEPVEANASYAGENETYVTDEDGTAVLPATNEDVTVNVTAEHGNETATTTVDLDAPVDLGIAVDGAEVGDDPVVTVTDSNETVENASVAVETVDENATYTGVGNDTTGANGTVALPVPETNVTVEVTAEYENETVSTTADLFASAPDEPEPFGHLVREFIASLDDRAGGIGSAVSEYVTENNPGNAPEHAGNGTDAGEGPPDHVGNESDTDDETGVNDGNGPGGGVGNGSGPGDGVGNGSGPPADILHTAKAVGFPHWGLNPRVAGGSQVRRHVVR